MTKNQFLTQLESSLTQLSVEERQDIILDFEEHFAIGKEQGKPEEEISASLGSPQTIARDMIATYHLDKMQTSATIGNILRAVWAIIGLSFFNLIIVIGPFIALVAIVLAGWISGIALTSSPILLLVNVLIYPNTFELFELFITIGFCGIGLFLIIAMIKITQLLSKGFVRYLKFNVKLVKGGLKS
ncbi:HAAS signaling domain-containing protein [Bacillus suaedae]|uniref:DUF1700 domain-containing protein n=1 Tax=Halalkalibacter suaedae TaxID=2822140 RepID=A0A940WUW5_9BACI|nr:DUF1700 domain-containing protein [Bacillus suaedae]MBP3950718.1 DUF1700 domain-containing protein [Bacillus suaedae]